MDYLGGSCLNALEGCRICPAAFPLIPLCGAWPEPGGVVAKRVARLTAWSRAGPFSLSSSPRPMDQTKPKTHPTRPRSRYRPNIFLEQIASDRYPAPVGELVRQRPQRIGRRGVLSVELPRASGRGRKPYGQGGMKKPIMPLFMP
jgi:hypothetical protein